MKNAELTEKMCPIFNFLGKKTPETWVEHAAKNLPILLIDHAHCERKAATTALTLIQRYPLRLNLVNKMSRLAREEMRHFEQVLAILKSNNIQFKNIAASRYAKNLYDAIRPVEPQRLMDTLILGAFIEARSCERFYALLPVLNDPILTFYRKLIISEARHFEGYLELAQELTTSQALSQRIDELREVENDLIVSNDSQFRFHSGVPIDKIKHLQSCGD